MKIENMAKILGKRGGDKTKATKPKDYFKKIRKIRTEKQKTK